MVPIVKILVVALATLLPKLIPGGSNPRDRPMDAAAARKALSNGLDFIFSVAFTAFLSIQLGAFKVSPLQSRGYDALGELILVLGMLALKGIFFILLPAILLCMLLRGIEGLGGRLVIYGIFAVIGATGYHFAMQRAKADAETAERAHRAAESARQAEQKAAVSMETARANAKVRESQQRTDYAAQLASLRTEAHQRWRADVEAAGVWGTEGVVPPMLVVRDLGNTQTRVTNLASKTVCVGLARVLRKPGTDVYERCPHDIGRRCIGIRSGGYADIPLYPDPTTRACAAGLLEYRVGTPLEPEPTWWSRSALDDFDRHPPDPNPARTSLQTLQMRGEIALLEKMLAETDRATRWRESSHR